MSGRLVGALVTGGLLLTACGTADSPIGGARSQDSETPHPRDADGDPLVTCGGPGFEISAMSGGVQGLVARDEVAAALERLVDEAGIDAPTALQDEHVDEAQWFVLGESDGVLTVATGSWDRAGPGTDAQVVGLEQVADGWDATGWGDCNLAPVSPPGLNWVDVTAQARDLPPSATSVPVWVSERECTSARDPRPFLSNPVVVEDEQDVTVYWTSTQPEGAQDCPGNPRVRRLLRLQAPLGERVLLDGSTWPPSPVELTPR